MGWRVRHVALACPRDGPVCYHENMPEKTASPELKDLVSELRQRGNSAVLNQATASAFHRAADAIMALSASVDRAAEAERSRIAGRLRDCNYPEALIAAVENGTL